MSNQTFDQKSNQKLGQQSSASIASSVASASHVTRRSFVSGMAALAGALALAGTSVSKEALASESGDAAANTTADLIVIGGGAGGLAAAAKAAQGGASVILLEAGSVLGGTTRYSGGHYKYIDDDFLAKLPERTEDSDAEIAAFLDYDPADFGDYADALTTLQDQIAEYLDGDDTLEFDSIEYWLVLHHLYCQGTDRDGVEAVDDYSVVAPSYYNQAEVHDWMVEGGIAFSDPQPNNRGAGGPLSVEPDGKGAGLIAGLEAMATEAGAQIVLDATATELVTDEGGRVTGVVASVDGQTVTYAANKAVLIATGGYCSNPELVAEQNVFDGIDDTVPSCEPSACDGTGMAMAQALGAATANTQFVQFFSFPSAQMTTIETIFPLCLGGGKMSVNLEGERFTDDSRRTYGGGSGEDTAPACNQTSGRYFIIGDASNVEALGDSLESYEESGLAYTADTLADAAEAAGLDGDVVTDTVATFNSYVEAGEDPDFGRTDLTDAQVDGAPYVVIPMSMYAQNTMGGLVINADGNVVDEDGNAIEGLYAAGEVTGNFDGVLRRHGDNFAQILYYGYLCGKTVAES